MVHRKPGIAASYISCGIVVTNWWVQNRALVLPRKVFQGICTKSSCLSLMFQQLYCICWMWDQAVILSEPFTVSKGAQAGSYEGLYKYCPCAFNGQTGLGHVSLRCRGWIWRKAVNIYWKIWIMVVIKLTYLPHGGHQQYMFADAQIVTCRRTDVDTLMTIFTSVASFIQYVWQRLLGNRLHKHGTWHVERESYQALRHLSA